MSAHNTMRIYHRYLGYFLSGIMAVYAISGIVMIFRQTDFLKSEKQNEKTLAPNLSAEELGRALRIRDFKIKSTEGNVMTFAQGTYNSETGVANYKSKELPYVMGRITELHKASTSQPLYFLNIFFGVSLLFFVISSFWMFLPKTELFTKGLYFALAGLLLTLILIFV
jgi:hypothetical protein